MGVGYGYGHVHRILHTMLLCLLVLTLPSLVATSQRDEIIEYYFHCGYSYKVILCLLFGIHGIVICLRQLKRILRRLGLRRRRRFDLEMCTCTIRALQVGID